MLNWLLGKKKGPEEVKSGLLTAVAPTLEADDEPTHALPGTWIEELQLRTQCENCREAKNDSEKYLQESVEDLMQDCEAIMDSHDFKLPMLPAVAMKLMDLLLKPEVSVREVSETVKFDPVLSARFLTVANSAHYATATRIETIQQATSLLGMNTVRNLVTSVAFHSTIFEDRRMHRNARQLWEHSIGMALYGTKLAEKVGRADHMIFLAGLLHDAGKIPALLLIQRALGSKQGVRIEFINALIEKYHTRTGVALLNHWKLPIHVRLAIGAHHMVNSMEEAQAQVALRSGDAGAEERASIAQTLALVVLTDKALSSLRFVDEPGDLNIIGTRLALESALSAQMAVEFLQLARRCKQDISALQFN